MDRIMIGDDLRWGKLVKSWATGKSYLGTGTSAPPIPRTVQELKDQCQPFGIAIKIPPAITGLAVMQYSAETLALRLPPKSLVEGTEAELGQQGSVYPMPAFYDALYSKPVPATANKLDLHACRIGDYSIRNCG